MPACEESFLRIWLPILGKVKIGSVGGPLAQWGETPALLIRTRSKA